MNPDDYMLPLNKRGKIDIDLERRCVWCDSVISEDRQSNALYIARIPKYCSAACEKAACNRRQYERNVKPRLAIVAQARKKLGKYAVKKRIDCPVCGMPFETRGALNLHLARSYDSMHTAYWDSR